MNIRLIAIEVGDLLKYDTSVNHIDRIGSAVFPFARDEFPQDSITSVRAKRIYDWLMSLGRHPSTSEERGKLIRTFVSRLATTDDQRTRILQILSDAGLPGTAMSPDALRRFDERDFHGLVTRHCRTLFG